MLEFEKVIRQLHSSVSLLEGEGHVAYIVFMLGFRKEISIIRKQLRLSKSAEGTTGFKGASAGKISSY